MIKNVTGQFSYTCSYCDRAHCEDHRLPEKHDCPSLYGHKSFATASDGAPPKPAGHNPSKNPESRAKSETNANTNLVERTKQKQRQRETSRDKRRKQRKEKYSSPDVNPDGSLQTPEYEGEIEEVAATNETGLSNPTGLLSRSTWFLLMLILLSIAVFAFVYL